MKTNSEPSSNTNYLLNIGLIKFSGDDSLNFLQGQLSNDLNELHSSSKNQWHYSGYCNQKGRLIALLKVWFEGDDIFVLMSKDLIESTAERLRKYVMRSKVVIEVFETAECFGISSIEILQAVLEDIVDTDLLDKINTSPNAVLGFKGLSVLKIANRYLLVDKTASAEIADVNKTMSQTDWLSEEINQGLPDVNLDSSELFIPQMLNLDLLGGINFKKGCYTGQEIVARMHYLGKLKQRMFVCELIEGDAVALQTGGSIYSDADLSKSVGTVVSSITNSDKLLAVLRLSEMKNSLYADSNAVIKVASQQPYEIPLTADTQPS